MWRTLGGANHIQEKISVSNSSLRSWVQISLLLLYCVLQKSCCILDCEWSKSLKPTLDINSVLTVSPQRLTLFVSGLTSTAITATLKEVQCGMSQGMCWVCTAECRGAGEYIYLSCITHVAVQFMYVRRTLRTNIKSRTSVVYMQQTGILKQWKPTGQKKLSKKTKQT